MNFKPETIGDFFLWPIVWPIVWLTNAFVAMFVKPEYPPYPSPEEQRSSKQVLINGHLRTVHGSAKNICYLLMMVPGYPVHLRKGWTQQGLANLLEERGLIVQKTYAYPYPAGYGHFYHTVTGGPGPYLNKDTVQRLARENTPR